MKGFHLDNIQINSVKHLLQYVSQEDVIFWYHGPFALDSKIPRYDNLDENDPSAAFIKLGGKLYYKDYASDSLYDILDFVQEYIPQFEGLGYHDTLQKIYEEVYGAIQTGEIQHIPEVECVAKTMNINIRRMDRASSKPWSKLKIQYTTLKKFNVYRCEEAYLNGRLFHRYNLDDPFYCFMVNKILQQYQLYRPFARKKSVKHRSHNVRGIVFGWKQFPMKTKLGFITSSAKDVLTLYENKNPSICPFGEGVLVPGHYVTMMRDRCRLLYTLMNNDEQGIASATKYWETYQIPGLVLPKLPYDEKRFPKGLTDPNDIVVNYDYRMLNKALHACKIIGDVKRAKN